MWKKQTDQQMNAKRKKHKTGKGRETEEEILCIARSTIENEKMKILKIEAVI